MLKKESFKYDEILKIYGNICRKLIDSLSDRSGNELYYMHRKPLRIIPMRSVTLRWLV